MRLENTAWRNDKTNDIYRVWFTAFNNHNDEYVIYQKPEISKTNQASFLVRHSENLLIGRCEMLPVGNRFKWIVSFDNQKQDIELSNKVLPWARPYEVFMKKFTLI